MQSNDFSPSPLSRFSLSSSFSTNRSSPSSAATSSATSTPSSSPEISRAQNSTKPTTHPRLSNAQTSTGLQRVSALATFFSENLTWLWFAPGPSNGQGSGGAMPRKEQLFPSVQFMRFCHDLLATTQVAHSVCILALLFVHRLKKRNSVVGSVGSEWRVATIALMLANKVLDDNTYTAKTWADVSGLELAPLVAGEAEFLVGLDWNLHVTEGAFQGWVKLLEGHVGARKLSRQDTAARRPPPPPPVSPSCQPELVGLGFGSVGLSHEGSVNRDSESWPKLRRPRTSQRLAHNFASFSFPPTPDSNPLTHAFVPYHSRAAHPAAYSPTSHPTATAPAARHSRLSTISMHTHSYSDVNARIPAQKRCRSEAFPVGLGCELAPSGKRQAVSLQRSLSTGAMPAAPPPVYVSTPNSSLQRGTRVPSLVHSALGAPQPSSALANPFLPHRPRAYPHKSLRFHPLTAGVRQGSHRTNFATDCRPPPPVSAPICRPSLSFVRSDYANAGLPGVLWVSRHA